MPSRSPVALYTALLAQQGLMQREKLLREWNVAKCANAHSREALLHSGQQQCGVRSRLAVDSSAASANAAAVQRAVTCEHSAVCTEMYYKVTVSAVVSTVRTQWL